MEENELSPQSSSWYAKCVKPRGKGGGRVSRQWSSSQSRYTWTQTKGEVVLARVTCHAEHALSYLAYRINRDFRE